MATASTIIKTASNEIGVKETGNNNVKYNTEYYGKAVNGDAYRGVQCSYGGCLNIPAHLAFFMEAEKQHLSMKFGDIIIH